MKSLYPLFYGNLSDSIPSVRQGAASSLASVVRAFGSASLENILSHIRQSLEVCCRRLSQVSTKSIYKYYFYV